MHEYRSWVRSWYQVGFEHLLFSPNPKIFIKLHCAAELEAMDTNGLSDPYVRIAVGAGKLQAGAARKGGLSALFAPAADRGEDHVTHDSSIKHGACV